MKTIVILPGVGIFDNSIPKYQLFKLAKKHLPDFKIVWCNWRHIYTIPETTAHGFIRKWFCEVLFDFQMVTKHADMVDIPKADYYIGHSAGTILALIQNRPCIICGSPALLVDEVMGEDALDYLNNSPAVYNIIHTRDIIAYDFPLAHVENEYIDSGWWSIKRWNPISAHLCYLRSKKISMKMINKIKEWDEIGI
jgi:hypothetical protein